MTTFVKTSTPPPLVALLTDFGTRDWYVACVKGVILRLCPGAHLLDITHDLPPFDILGGAFTLAAAAPWLPLGTVCACVVDPGVGMARRILAAQVGGRVFIGPDNGLLALLLARATRRRIVHVTNRAYWLPHVSRTFHGRDIMAPVAAHVARGVPLSRLGPTISRYTALPLPPLTRTATTITATIGYIDRFGNLITTLPAEVLVPGARVTYKSRRCRVVSTYGAGQPGELIAVAGSTGYIEVAVRNGSAATCCRARVGDRVEMRRR